MSETVSETAVKGQLKAGYTVGGVLGHIIIWILLSVITFGIAAFFWPYAAAKLIINDAKMYDNSGAEIGRLKCNLTFGGQIGHILLWILISIITLGIALPFYFYGVGKKAIDNTVYV